MGSLASFDALIQGAFMQRLIAIAFLLLATPAFARVALQPPLAPLGFLIGSWKSDDGKVADIGGTSKGGSEISVASDGWAILRADHTELFDRNQKPAGSFHQTMIIYSDGGALHAEYVDGQGHVIHYTSAEIVAGKSVIFSSAAGQGPVFRLKYALQSPGILDVSFGMIAPGQTDFRPIANGTLRRQN
jgi:hypothetical protein